MKHFSNDKFKVTFGSLAIPLLVIDKKGIIRYNNGAWDDLIQNNNLSITNIKDNNYFKYWRTKKKNKDIVEEIKQVIFKERSLFTFTHSLSSNGKNNLFKVKVTPFKEKMQAAIITYESINEKDCHEFLFDNSLYASALHKMVFDEENNPVDYIFLKVNNVFEEQTGLSADEITHKKVTKVLPRIKKETDFIERYGEVVLTQKSQQFTRYSKPLNRWYKILVYPVGEDRFITNFIDITEQQKIKEELKEKNELLEGVINAIPDAIGIQKIDHTIERYNKAGYEMLDESLEEIKGRKCYELLGKEKKCSNCPTEEALKTKELAETEKYIADKDIHLHVRSQPILDKNGEVVRIVEQLKDITKRKKAEQKLKARNNLLNGVLESIEGSISVLNPDLSIRYTDETIKKWYKDKLPLKGKKCFKVYHDRAEPCEVCPTLETLATGESREEVISLSINSETKIMKVNSYPMKDSKTGEVTGIVEFAQDITEQKQMERKLKESERRYRKLFEASPMGIMLEDKEGKIIEVNKTLCNITNYSKEELEGKTVFETLIPPGAKEEAKQHIEKILAGEDIEFEGKTHTRNGRLRYFKLWETKIKLANDEEAILSIQTDITRRKKIEFELKEKNEKLFAAQEQLEKINKELKKQLQKGKEIHHHLLPTELPQCNGIKIASLYRSAEKIGADFYQTIELENKIILYISDVTGHNLDGAFLNVFLRETVKTFLDKNYYPNDDISLTEIIEYINYRYQLEEFPDDYFISLFLFAIDKESNEVSYINAGCHIAPILVEEGEIYQITAKGLPISNVLNSKFYNFKEQKFVLNERSTLLITTDGLIEEEAKGNIYGETRLEKFIQNNYRLPAEILLAETIKDLEGFTGKEKVKDDITLLAVTNRKIIDEFSLTIPSKYEKIEFVKNKIADFVSDYCNQVDYMLIGLQEVAINAIEHGNKKNYDVQVKFRVSVLEESIVIEVEDEGSGFDWEGERKKEIDPTDFSERGRGLAIANQAFDNLGYNQAGNKAVLYKKRDFQFKGD